MAETFPACKKCQHLQHIIGGMAHLHVVQTISNSIKTASAFERVGSNVVFRDKLIRSSKKIGTEFSVLRLGFPRTEEVDRLEQVSTYSTRRASGTNLAKDGVHERPLDLDVWSKLVMLIVRWQDCVESSALVTETASSDIE